MRDDAAETRLVLTKHEAANAIQGALLRHGLVNGFDSGTRMNKRIIQMFKAEWPALSKVAHTLHDAIERERDYRHEPRPPEPRLRQAEPTEVGYELVPSERWTALQSRIGSLEADTEHRLSGLADEVAKLQAGWSDVNRQLVGLRERVRLEEAEGKETVERLLRLEGRIAAIDAAVALRFEEFDRHFDQRCDGLSVRLDELDGIKLVPVRIAHGWKLPRPDGSTYYVYDLSPANEKRE